MKYFITCCLFIVVSHLVFAQKQDQTVIDSLSNALKTEKDDTEKVIILYNLSIDYRRLGNNQIALEHGKAALALAQKSQFNNGIAAAHNNIGNIYEYQGNYSEALNSFLEALKIFESGKDKHGIAGAQTNIGGIYNAKNNYKEALKYYQSALKIRQEIEEQQGIAAAFNDIGTIYYKQKKFTDALQNFAQSHKIYEQLDDQQGLSMSFNNLGLIYCEQRKFTEALRNFFESLKIKETIGDKKGTALAYNNIGNTYSKLNQHAEAKKWQEKGLALSKEIGSIETIQNTYSGLAIVDSALGNFKGAFENNKLFTLYKDSLFNEENTRKLTQIEMNVEFEKQQDSIRLENEKEIAVRDATLKSNREQKYFYVAGIIGLTVIGGLLYNQNRLRKKKNKELDESNKVKARFFSILSHDLRAPIASLSNYIYLLNEEDDIMETEVKKAHQNKIGTATNNLLSTMEDILLWSKSQMERFEPVKKIIAVAQLFDDVQKLIPQDIEIDISFQNPDQLELHTDENYLKTIMRNLTANAIKALKGKTDGKVEWKAWQQNGKKYLSIADNGPGLSQEQQEKMFNDDAVISTKTGLGLHLVRDLTKMLQHKMEVISATDKGTSFTIVID